MDPSLQNNIMFIDPALLEKIERGLWGVVQQTRATAALLIDRSGLVLAFVGDPPLHPSQMGAVAAGIFSAMNIIIKASRSGEFVVRVPETGANLHFQHVDKGAFLCTFYADPKEEARVREVVGKLATEARQALTQEQTTEHRVDNVNYITEKLNELFRD